VTDAVYSPTVVYTLAGCIAALAGAIVGLAKYGWAEFQTLRHRHAERLDAARAAETAALREILPLQTSTAELLRGVLAHLEKNDDQLNALGRMLDRFGNDCQGRITRIERLGDDNNASG